MNVDGRTTNAIEVLGRVAYFRDQDPETLCALADAATRQSYAAGTVLFVQDEPVVGLCVVEQGAVKISRHSAEGREHIMHVIQAGEAFNEVAALDGGPNPATAIARTDASVWCIRRPDLQRIADRQPALAWAMAATIAGHTRHMVDLVDGLVMRSVRGRLAHLLLGEARSHGTDALPRNLTQEEMASRLGTVREMVGRVLRSLAAEEVIEFDRHHIRILDPGRLAEEAEA